MGKWKVPRVRYMTDLLILEPPFEWPEEDYFCNALLVCPWSIISRESRSKSKALTSLTSRFCPSPKNHGDSVAFLLAICIVLGSFLSRERLHQHSPSSPFYLLVGCLLPYSSLRSKPSQSPKPPSSSPSSPSLPARWPQLPSIPRALWSASSARLF